MTTGGVPTPDGVRYRFVILGTVWSSYIIVYLSRLSVGPLSPFLKESFDLCNTEIGSLMSATALTYAPTMIVAGLIIDRVGAKPVLVSGAFVTGLCVCLLFVAPSYPALLVLLALSGIGCGCIYPCAVKALVAWFPARERATAIGVNQSAINISGILGAALLPAVALSLGWRFGFLFVGILALVISMICLVLYRDAVDQAPPIESRPSVDDLGEDDRCDAGGGNQDASNSGTSTGSSWHGLLTLLKERDVWLLGIGGLLMGAVEFSAIAYMVLFLSESLAYTVVAAGGLLAFCETAGAIGKPSVGLVSDRLFRGRRKPVLLVLSFLAFGVCSLFATSDGMPGWILYAVLVLFGVAAVGWAGIYATLAGELGGGNRSGLAAGLCSAMTNVGIVVGPLAFGMLVDQTGSYRFSWILMAAAAGIGLTSWLLVREPRPATTDEIGGVNRVPASAAQQDPSRIVGGASNS